MSTHNICFHGEIRKILTWYPPLSRPMRQNGEEGRKGVSSFPGSVESNTLSFPKSLYCTGRLSTCPIHLFPVSTELHTSFLSLQIEWARRKKEVSNFTGLLRDCFFFCQIDTSAVLKW